MPVKVSISVRVLGDLKKALKDKPSGTTTRDLAHTLDIPISRMYQYLKRFHRLGLIESAGLAPEPRKKGRRPKLWRWVE